MKERCSKCVLSGSLPGIEFDEACVCNFCRDEAFVSTSQEALDTARERVQRLIGEKKGTARYDAVFCYSGGKDSTYTMKLAVEKYGLEVLSFTLDNGFLAPEALININKVVDNLGVDQVTVRPASTIYKSVIKAVTLHEVFNPRSLTRISAGCNACISLVNITALKLALQYDAPFIIAGFTLGQIPVNAVVFKNNYRFLQESRERSLERLRYHVGDAVDDYYTIDENTISAVKTYPTTVNLLCLEEISEDDIVREIAPLGWKRPDGVDGCSSNCRLNTFNNYVHERRHGYNPYELELSHLIRKGQMSRDEAVAKIHDQPRELLDGILSELDISSEDLSRSIEEADRD